MNQSSFKSYLKSTCFSSFTKTSRMISAWCQSQTVINQEQIHWTFSAWAH